MWHDDLNVSVLVGKTLASVKNGDYSIIFTTTNGERYEMSHQQD